MKKLLTTLLIMALSVVTVFTMTACKKDGDEETGFCKEVLSVTSQLDAVSEVKKGTADAAVIDSIMANYYATTGTYAGQISVVDLGLAKEEYAIAAKKGNESFMSKINEALIALRDTDVTTVLEDYGLENEIAYATGATNPYESSTDNSWNEIKDSGVIVIGYTVFAPICMEGATAGIDVELAKKVVAYLNSTYSLSLVLDFQLIEWSQKEALLENGTIDLVWNGMTVTAERASGMTLSISYLYNKQVAVVLKEDESDYTSKDDFKDAIVAVEKGSAGETVAKGE